MNPYNHALVQRVLDDKHSKEDLKDLIIAYSNAWNAADRAEMENTMAQVRINELEISIRDMSDKILEMAKVTPRK